ncbi:MAG: PAS domain S-box protein [Anaerolineae bacterium]|nr:PAS domain S-box protein [Anaerolineae bacterium]
MLNPLLEAQLAQFNLANGQLPDEDTWQALLAQISQTYGQRAAEQDRLQAVLDNVADAIVTFDEHGRIEWFNRAAEQMFGYRAAEVIGAHLELLLPDPHRYRIEQDALALQTDKQDGRADIVSIRNEIAGQRQDGSLFPLDFTISQMMVQGERQFIAIARDITIRKEAEQAILTAKEAAEAANQAKTQFLANTSHEIRTPLNAIVGLTSLLLDTELTPDQQTFVEIARRSSHTLLTILNDILDLSRIEARQLSLELRPYHLRTGVTEVLNLLKTNADEKKLQLTAAFAADMPQVFIGDGDRLRQVLVNLVSNAIKFTHAGSILVQVDGRYLDPATYEIHLSVQDTGIGLPPDYTEWLFQPFHRGHAGRSRRYSGAGLGLTISQRLVELMSGRIWAESESGKGSTFHVCIPSPVTEQPLPSAPTLERVRPFDPDMARQLPLRILVAEDNITNQKVMVWMLEHLGYRPDVAANGLEVLAALQKNAYDVILMDLHMPEMDGRIATQTIRATLPSAEQPWIIAVTADVLHESRQDFMADGLNDFLSKPLQAEMLITALCRYPAAQVRSVAQTWPVDRAVLNQITGGDSSRLIELTHIFQNESDQLLAQLQTAVAADDLETARQMAHALKGSCATMGMVSLEPLFREIETMARSRDQYIAAKVTQAITEYDRVLLAMRNG